MFDEKLQILIRKYGIFDAIGGGVKQREFRGFWGKVCKIVRLCIGGGYLIWVVNSALNKVNDGDKIALWFVDGGRKQLRAWMYFFILSPRNRKKIQFLVVDKKSDSMQMYRGRPVLSSGQIAQYPIDVMVLTLGIPQRHVGLVGRDFSGQIIDMNLLIQQNRAGWFLFDVLRQHPYVDIFISRHYRDQAVKRRQKQMWHRRLIAHYLRARDFLRAAEEIEHYVKAGYEDADIYCSFWRELEELLCDIKRRLEKRKQIDIFLYWIDCIEKKDFYSMRWVGNRKNGRIFHRAYTTMLKTTMVLRSIFTGKNAKAGRLFDLGKMSLDATVFAEYPSKQREIHAFSGVFSEKLDDSIMHPSCQYYGRDVPFTLLMWNAIDSTLTALHPCVNILHCMETHPDYLCGETQSWPFGIPFDELIPLGYSLNCTEIAKIARDYLDRQLEWYYSILSQNSINIYMSDHGPGDDLMEERFSNVPFKILGRNIAVGDEYRFFSYKNMYKLFDSIFHSDGFTDDFFSDYAVIDYIDPYDRGFAKAIREHSFDGCTFTHKKFESAFLKKYIQRTKLTTSKGEYYSINILGEEEYYRDTECKINLAHDSLYATRIAELREKAGKFWNPWKEKNEAAIDFYEYIGIEEKDIVARCY